MDQNEKSEISLDTLVRQASVAAEQGDREKAKQLFQKALDKCGVPTAPSWSNTDVAQANCLSSIADAMTAAGLDEWAKDVQNRANWIYRADEAEYFGTYRGY